LQEANPRQTSPHEPVRTAGCVCACTTVCTSQCTITVPHTQHSDNGDDAIWYILLRSSARL